ncbi:MAG TPA: UDP-glucose 6-dehydrogenase [Spongiibacteraceae bacterium]|nr:UDP-glucose 6-dehydrogenase [Spongiibacteraceae bacterium]HCS28026.1 UDP-glucose 6-dehydrogenase [Spongiibacteraceae bacterium]|tara:strand:- start:186 stop:1577 length:1392 start_codon:yes stop_codon:yes gene_type:complete
MKIAVIGSGYVGLVTGACLTEMGNRVVCIDQSREKIERLRAGDIPIYEPGLEPVMRSATEAGLLAYSDSIAGAIGGADYIFIAVGTPMQADGHCDLSAVFAVAESLGRYLSDDAVIVVKSTVPVGAGDKVAAIIGHQLAIRGERLEFDVVSNPEFLKEGTAVADFMTPDRIIIGAESERARELMSVLYAPYLRRNDRVMYMGRREAEMTKYASNAMLAARISFMNEIANLCESRSVDVEQVRLGMGADQRIGNAFLYPGAGYGGSCFPKDVRALIATGADSGVDMAILRAVDARNDLQKRSLFEKLYHYYAGNLKGRQIGVWGLAFKPGTDDIREAPSVMLIEQLLEAGASVCAYDPVAAGNMRAYFAGHPGRARLHLAAEQYEAANSADALVLVTEWKRFRQPDFRALVLAMRGKLIVDGRNQYDPGYLRRIGFDYMAVGRDNRRLRAELPRMTNGRRRSNP